MLNAYWVQVNNNMQAGPNINEETYPGYRNPDNFIVVSDAYPTVTALAADLDPADRDVGREGRRLRQCRAAHAVLAPARHGARRSALRSVAADGVLQALQDRGGLARGAAREEAGISRQDAVRRALQERPGRQVSAVATSRPATTTTKSKAFGFYVQKGLFEEYATFGRGHGHDLAPFDTYHQERGLRWPVVNGKETLVAFPRRLRSVREAGHRRPVLRLRATARRASSRCPTSRRRNCPTRTIRSGCRPAACWSTGTPAP